MEDTIEMGYIGCEMKLTKVTSVVGGKRFGITAHVSCTHCKTAANLEGYGENYDEATSHITVQLAKICEDSCKRLQGYLVQQRMGNQN